MSETFQEPQHNKTTEGSKLSVKLLIFSRVLNATYNQGGCLWFVLVYTKKSASPTGTCNNLEYNRKSGGIWELFCAP